MSHKEKNDGFVAARSALIFSWRRSFRRRWAMAAAIMLVTPIIVGLFAAIHVRGFSVPSGHLRRAEMLVFVEDPSSRDWLEKISQQTPFPVLLEKDRIESLSAPVWEEIASMKYHYVAELRDVVVPDPKPVFEKKQVLPVLPEVVTAADPGTVSMNRHLQPRLKLLAQLNADDLPGTWPEFYGNVESFQGMRYLLEIDEKGNVVSCLAAGKEAEKRNVALENWMKSLVFPKPERVKGWLGCEVIGTNVDD
jgi:hypothetical protein